MDVGSCCEIKKYKNFEYSDSNNFIECISCDDIWYVWIDNEKYFDFIPNIIIGAPLQGVGINIILVLLGVLKNNIIILFWQPYNIIILWYNINIIFIVASELSQYIAILLNIIILYIV